MKLLILITLLLNLTLQQHPASKASKDSPQSPPSATRIPGLIDYSDERTKNVITAPDTVAIGEDFQITITTSGGGCEYEGDTGLIAAESTATIMVYDFTTATRPGIACTAIYKQLPHTVTLRFMKPGEALIRVWGRRIGRDTPPFGVPTVLERKVVVK